MPFRFVFKSNSSFDYVQSEFFKLQIIVRKGVDQLLHRLNGLEDSRFPTSVELFRKAVSIPIYPGLTSVEENRIVNALRVLSD